MTSGSHTHGWISTAYPAVATVPMKRVEAAERVRVQGAGPHPGRPRVEQDGAAEEPVPELGGLRRAGGVPRGLDPDELGHAVDAARVVGPPEEPGVAVVAVGGAVERQIRLRVQEPGHPGARGLRGWGEPAVIRRVRHRRPDRIRRDRAPAGGPATTISSPTTAAIANRRIRGRAPHHAAGSRPSAGPPSTTRSSPTASTVTDPGSPSSQQPSSTRTDSVVRGRRRTVVMTRPGGRFGRGRIPGPTRASRDGRRRGRSRSVPYSRRRRGSRTGTAAARPPPRRWGGAGPAAPARTRRRSGSAPDPRARAAACSSSIRPRNAPPTKLRRVSLSDPAASSCFAASTARFCLRVLRANSVSISRPDESCSRKWTSSRATPLRCPAGRP